MIKPILRFGVLILGIIFSIIAYYLNLDDSSPSLFGIFFLLAIVFVLFGLLLATRSSMLGFGKDLKIINGIGTTLYGESNFNPIDKSYIVTKWIVFFYLPIIPLASYRVIKEDTTQGFLGPKTMYNMKDVPLNKGQIIKAYLTTYGLLILIIGILYLYIMS